MSSNHFDDIDHLFRSGTSDPASMRTALQRLSHSLSEKNARSNPEALDYVTRTFQLLGRIKGGSNLRLRVACLYECGLFFWQHGLMHRALEAAELRHSLAVRGELWDQLPFTLNSLAMVAADLGNLSESISYYAEALESVKGATDPEAEGMILINLGVALEYSGLYGEAISCLTKATTLYRSTWKRDIRRKALSNIAQNYYYLEQFDRALHCISECLDSAKEPSNSTEHFDRSVRESTYALIALELHQNAIAYQHASLAVEHARASGAVRSRWMAEMVMGRYEVAAGDRPRGLMILERNLSETVNVDSNYRDALMAIVKAHDDAGMPETALIYMEKLLAHVRGCRVKGVGGLLLLRESKSAGPIVDLRVSMIEHRHADLRARVAERNAANAHAEMLERLAVTADLKEDASGEHGYRVGKLSALLASRIGWSDEAAQSLELAARLHDIGKTGIPDRILGSSEALKEAERHLMQAHASIGAELLSKSDVPQLKMAEEIARRHHECWDGSGYPDGLRGNRIPAHARIVALADVFDALTHGRPYAAPWTIDRALDEIRARRGTQFDPELTNAFLGLVEKLRAEHADLDAFLALAGRDAPLLKARRRIRVMLEEETRHEAVAAH